MRVYHALVFDENIEGNAALYTDPSFNAQLALCEKLYIYTLSDTVTGTATLTVQIEDSPDGVHFNNRTGTAEINAQSISATAVTTLVARDAGTNLASAFARLRVSIGGTTVKGHVRIWVTGRGEQVM
jgi:hypothetical protein